MVAKILFDGPGGATIRCRFCQKPAEIVDDDGTQCAIVCDCDESQRRVAKICQAFPPKFQVTG